MVRSTMQIYISEELKRKAKIKAAQQGTSVSAVVREALRRWIAEDPPKEQQKK